MVPRKGENYVTTRAINPTIPPFKILSTKPPGAVSVSIPPGTPALILEDHFGGKYDFFVVEISEGKGFGTTVTTVEVKKWSFGERFRKV